MRPGITFLAALKVHINGGNKITPITILKKHGRQGHIPLDLLKISYCHVIHTVVISMTRV